MKIAGKDAVQCKHCKVWQLPKTGKCKNCGRDL